MAAKSAYFLLEASSMHFECIISTGLEKSSVVTEHPVEEGANIVDHMRPEADRISLEVKISNDPIDYDDPDGVATQYGGSVQTVNLDDGQNRQLSGLKAQLLTFPSGFNVLADTQAKLDQLRLAGTRFDVAMPSGYFANMVVEKVSEKRVAASGSGGDLSIALKKVRVATSQTVASPKPKEPRAQLKVDKGQQQPTAAPKQIQSGAAALLDAFGVGF